MRSSKTIKRIVEMEIAAFYNKVKQAISESKLSDARPLSDYFDQVFLDKNQNDLQKMTRLTVAFEAFYRSLPDDSFLKKIFLDIRTERWESHYGTPTITFLLTYQTQIQQLSESFKLSLNASSIIDTINQVIITSPENIAIAMPEKEEKTGEFIKTHNPSGGFTTAPADPVSQQFIESAKEAAKNGGKVLEIGAGFGAATLQALAQGATVFCKISMRTTLLSWESVMLHIQKIQKII